MAGTSNLKEQELFFTSLKHFPSVINGRINLECFLQASSDLVTLVGTYFSFTFKKYAE